MTAPTTTVTMSSGAAEMAVEDYPSNLQLQTIAKQILG